MKSVLVGAFSFFSAPTVAMLLFIMASLPSRPMNKGTTELDAFILPAYLLVVSMAAATVGFIIVTAMSPKWRGLSPKQAALIAGPLGLTYYVFHFVGLVATYRILGLLPLWLAAILMHLIPGVVIGLIAVLLAALLQRVIRRRSAHKVMQADAAEPRD